MMKESKRKYPIITFPADRETVSLLMLYVDSCIIKILEAICSHGKADVSTQMMYDEVLEYMIADNVMTISQEFSPRYYQFKLDHLICYAMYGDIYPPYPSTMDEVRSGLSFQVSKDELSLLCS